MTFSHERYNTVVNETIENIKQLSNLKGGEYAGDDDRLANFRRNAIGLGLGMEQVWAVYAAKHWDAIMQYVKDQGASVQRTRMEPISGRLDDLIVYAILMKCIVEESDKKYENTAPWVDNDKAQYQDLGSALKAYAGGALQEQVLQTRASGGVMSGSYQERFPPINLHNSKSHG